MARRIILDTDLAMGAPGSDIDDGFALALALAEPDLSVELVTTVNGNTDVETATALTLELLDRLGRTDVPVVKGALTPLRRPLHPTTSRAAAAAARGGLPQRSPQAGAAATAIVEAVMAAPGQVTIVAIGPLTNVALAMRLEPRLAGSVQEIVVMGGVYLQHTNRLDMPGEFNIWVDPDAAAIVLDSGAPLRLVGLDVTLQVRLGRDDAERMAAGGRPFGEFAGRSTLAWIEHLASAGRGRGEEAGTCAMHDPLAVAVVAHPELVTWSPAVVAVEAVGDVARGVTVADFLDTPRADGVASPAPNCSVATAVDVERFTTHFLDRIAAL